MRYRQLDAAGDMTFGASQQNFLVDSPDAVAQAVQTRLRLIQGEWFLDVTEGMPWATEVLGVRTSATYDAAIKACILGTQGVVEILSYSSSLTGRALSVSAVIDTIYGQAAISKQGIGFPVPAPPAPAGLFFGQLDFTDPAQSALIPGL